MRKIIDIREKAVRIAVRTGWMPDLDFIWKWQQSEGYEPCFGSCCESCTKRCRWYKGCLKVSREPIDSPWPTGKIAGQS